MGRTGTMPTRRAKDGELVDTGHGDSRGHVHPGTEHAGLRQVLNQVEVFLLGLDEVLAAPTLADTGVLRRKLEPLLKELHGIYKVYKL